MSGKWKLTSEEFDDLLSWLDPDRERAGIRYEEIRDGLIKKFRLCWCSAAEDLADETINRVVKKPPEFRGTYKGNPERYFFGVAKHVEQEYQRKKGRQEPLEIDLPGEPPDLAEHGRYEEEVYDCLDKCLQKLPPVPREIVRRYYAQDSPAQRRALARRLGITVEALRVKVFRIMQELKPCVEECVGRGGAE